uniref:Polyadenylate-binding protein n=1 Tax=Fibrocapsa japonica TaxID=94617 RepID=A0A7S2V0L8_9STRA|mmetsp:Transcript_1984/g.2856  ORF Transcript_1984/g.2856 Transcript_1984/m.2856 type:complete len:634 (+) Transcript_1984:259-2160(+)
MIPAQQQPPTPFHSASLYVGDLAPDVSEALLFEIFNAVGPVASIRVCRDTVTRRSLGYAYVNFHNVADAERALDTMNYTLIKGVPCRIMWSQRDPSLRRSGVGNIFVKNLDPSVDNKALYDTFSLFGNILSCKVVVAKDDQGYGYVHYETAEAANEAIAKINGMLIAGKEVYVGHFVKRQDRASASDWTNLYIKNIPEDWSEEKLNDEFGKFGEVTSVKAVIKKMDPVEEGAPPPKVAGGYGFVNYADHESAVKAVEAMNGLKLKHPDGEEREMYAGRAQKKAERERELRAKFESLKAERINKYQGVNLYVKNLDDSITDEGLREEFTAYGTITSARVMRDSNGNSRGFGFVCYSAPEEATKAVSEANGKLINGKPVYIALAQRREVRRAQLEAQYARSVGGLPPRGIPLGQPGMYGAMPMYAMPPGQGIPPQASRGYPMMPAMMPRGAPRGPLPQYGARGAYPMPAYAMGPLQQQQQQQQRRSGRQRQAGRGGGAPRVGGQQPGQQQVRPGAMPVPPLPPPPPPGPVSPQDPLTPAALAAATPEQQKNMIGERLYPLIQQSQPELAGKITGMLLEMDNGELLHLLESPEALATKIAEALAVLEQHNAQMAAAAAAQAQAAQAAAGQPGPPQP